MAESAAFKDASGKLLFTVFINASTYDCGWPVKRNVVESGDVPGLVSGGWSPVYHYALYAEEPAGGSGPGTICTLALVRAVPVDGPGMLRGLPEGGPMPAETWTGPYFIAVELGPDVEKCGSVADAKAWWASSEGQQIKAAVASLTAG
ncbi:hypothetical protein [Arthrobacter sp. ISL-30]|uniref:hypothetical protein n=1 Tax=Arthrobacter sp. ISL-30 TaxID=2819109 RepID=UPI001BE5F93B|nr:hypothetical protein [Arthrobacter sp. ISL-30]MBT2513852.1 hypothetical protein [Arthrobacter sp. ISL-30]